MRHIVFRCPNTGITNLLALILVNAITLGFTAECFQPVSRVAATANPYQPHPITMGPGIT